ncbi:MAG: hypothetical protein HGB19_06000 [Chlorobiales bacterium]|nr:hypothetical protein [Chlorobiales bacterium]
MNELKDVTKMRELTDIEKSFMSLFTPPSDRFQLTEHTYKLWSRNGFTKEQLEASIDSLKGKGIIKFFSIGSKGDKSVELTDRGRNFFNQ